MLWVPGREESFVKAVEEELLALHFVLDSAPLLVSASVFSAYACWKSQDCGKWLENVVNVAKFERLHWQS